jgi:D-tyrosyl-tRNA(Tyr) deacylase
MRAIVQRVRYAVVRVGDEEVGRIARGLCVLVGVRRGDEADAAHRLADKLWHLRVFPDAEGAMNRSAAAEGLALLVVSQFTLYGDTRRGRRPSFVDAAPGPEAEPLVDEVVSALRSLGAEVATGRFGADMAIELVNEGPVTLTIEV